MRFLKFNLAANWLICFRTIVLVCLFPVLTGEETESAEEKSETSPVITAVLCSRPPIIDGNLADPCWEEAYQTEDFRRMDKNESSTERTKAFICYDKEGLYVAFYCFDTQPDKIRAMQKKRGGMIWQDDLIEIGLDTYHAHKECYWFDLTAGGTQFDEIPGGSGTNVEWRGDWQGATRRVEDGWIAEIAIPWKILRFPKSTTVMGIYVVRNIPRLDTWLSWPNLGSSWDSKKMADLVRLELPEIKHPPIVLPYLLGITQKDNRGQVSAGLNVKQLFGSGLTASLTFNPDFQTIEDEVESIDFSYTERYISDRRPFFTEGKGFFPGSSMFYTRRIEDVDAGVKLFGRMGKARVGVLDVVDVGHQNDFSSKLVYDLTSDSNLWLAGAHTSRTDSSDATVGFGGYYNHPMERGGFGSGFSFNRNLTGEKRGNVFSASIDKWSGGTGGIWFSANLKDVQEGYTSWTAYLPEENYWKAGVNTGLWKKYDEGLVKSHSVWGSISRAQSHADTLMYQEMNLGGDVNIRKFNTFGVSLSFSYDKRARNTDRTLHLGLSWNRDDIHKKGRVKISVGKKAGADYFFLKVGQGCKVIEDLGFNIRGELRRMKEASEEAEYRKLVVLTGNYDLTHEHSIGFRLMHRYDSDGENAGSLSLLGRGDLNLCLTYHQAVRAGTDIFFVLGDANEETIQKRFAVKLIRPIF